MCKYVKESAWNFKIVLTGQKHMISYLIEQHGDIILVPREDAQLAALEKDEAAVQWVGEADIEAGGETIEAVNEAGLGLRLFGRHDVQL